MKRLALVLFAASGLSGQDALEIIRRSVERDWTDFEARKAYIYQQRSELREYGRDGKISTRRSETKEILVFGGRPAERLIARNDKPLPESEAYPERRKFDKE